MIKNNVNSISLQPSNNLHMIGLSLYIVNKMAKQYAEARELLKDRLFNREPRRSYNEQVIALVDSFYNIVGLNDYKLHTDYDLTNMKRSDFLSEWREYFRNGGFTELVDYNTSVYALNQEDSTEADCLIYMIADELAAGYCSNDDDYSEILTPEAIEVVEYYKSDFIDEYISVMGYFDLIDKLHGILSDTFHTKENLYSLKEAVIKSLDLKPVRYHYINDDHEHVFLLYKISDFTFHLPIDEEEIPENIEISPIARIDSAIMVRDSSRITLDTALNFLLQFLNIPAEKKDDILYGTFDACNHLGIVKNPYTNSHSNNYNDDDYDEFYDLDDDYMY